MNPEIAAIEDANARNVAIVKYYQEEVSKGNYTLGYMLTITRDGENNAPAIYNYNSIIDAVNGYNAYTDWGFAKDYITVTLYEPLPGKITSKTNYRPRGGECTFVKQDYKDAEEILLSIKDKVSEDVYTVLVTKFARLFSKDNLRFSYTRFFEITGCQIPKDIDFL